MADRAGRVGRPGSDLLQMRRLWSGGVLEAVTHRPVHADVCGGNETDLNYDFAASRHSRDKEADGQDVGVESVVEDRPNAVVPGRVRDQTDVRRQGQPYKQVPATVYAEEVDVDDHAKGRGTLQIQYSSDPDNVPSPIPLRPAQ